MFYVIAKANSTKDKILFYSHLYAPYGKDEDYDFIDWLNNAKYNEQFLIKFRTSDEAKNYAGAFKIDYDFIIEVKE